MIVYGAFVASIAIAAIAATIAWSIRFAPRWGTIPGPAIALGGGAYRAQDVRLPIARGTPAIVSWASGVGLVWAVLTSLVLAPTLLCAGAGSADTGVASIVTGVGLVVTGSSGFFLGIALACVAFFVIRRDRDAVDLAEGAVVWSILHHLAGLFFVVLHALSSPVPSLLILTAPFWLIGLAHAYALEDAARLACEAPPCDDG